MIASTIDRKQTGVSSDVRLLVGAAAFWSAARTDIAAARRRVLVQAMTFEGDAAGGAVAAAVDASTAADRRILVDDYSRHVVNDHVIAATRDPTIRREARDTKAMFDALVARGVGVRVTNPIGRNPARYAVRNHKKLIVADDVAYIGGINFSDHNFAWHDMMIRIAAPAAADFLAGDFQATWESRPVPSEARFGAVALAALDGRDNAAGFAETFAAISAARATIDMVSAYPTFPFVDALVVAARRGVRVRLFTPLPNNKPVVRDYVVPVAEAAGIEVRLLPEMTHLKAMLVDGERLVAGSSNFDFASWRVEEEYLAILDDPALAADFRAAVIAPMEASAHLPGHWRPTRWQAAKARAALRLADAAVRAMRGTRRCAVDWR